MKRIIIHWTAGGHTPSNLDRGHYHFIIAGDGSVVPGKWPVAANAKATAGRTDYAAHTRNCNTGSIGVAVAAMAGAVERPFNAGKSPITQAQMTALAALCRDLAAKYKIPVTRETVLSHAEVQPTLGIKQKGKWDIAWLPGMKAPGDPVAVGDKIRAMVAGAKAPVKAGPAVPDGIKQLGFSDVKSFQGAYGLEVDGIVGPKTRAAMKKALSGVAATAPKSAPQRESAAPAPDTAEKRKGVVPLVLGLLVGGYATLAAFYNDNLAPVIDWLIFWQ
jgi:hypothetical protein